MHVIPQGTYAASLNKFGVAKGRDTDVSAAIMQAINELLPTASNKPASTAPNVGAAKVDHRADAKG